MTQDRQGLRPAPRPDQNLDEEMRARVQDAMSLAMAPLAQFLAALRVLRADGLFWLSWLAVPAAVAGLAVAAHYEQIGSVPQQIYVGLGGGSLVMVLTPIIFTASQFFPRLVFSLMGLAILAAGALAGKTEDLFLQLAAVTLTVALSLCLSLDLVLRRIQDALRTQRRQAREARDAVDEAVDAAARAEAERQPVALNGGAVAETLLLEAAKAEQDVRQRAAAAGVDLDGAAKILQQAERLRAADPQGYARAEAWLVEETGAGHMDAPPAN